MRRPLVAANWKMHGQGAQAAALMQALVAGLADAAGVDVLVCPPFVHLALAQAALAEVAAGGVAGGGSKHGSAKGRMQLGAQNVHQEDEGAFTGEISAPMLADAGCSHVLVGHSERRALCGETDAIVAAKFVAAQRAGLTPVLCVGESAAQRQQGSTAGIVRRQLQAVVESAGAEAFAGAVIAYEPVWAIGTGLTARPEQAQEVHALIRAELSQCGCAGAAQVRILYGGSVRAANAAELLGQPDIDGALVGGASLVADEFLAICRAAFTR
ncbi:MAG: triose-phosphate isomerase [Pseudohongiellaceae bacterium]